MPRRPRYDLSPTVVKDLIDRAKQMRDEGKSIGGIARELDIGYEWLRRRLDPGYAERSTAKWRACYAKESFTKVTTKWRPRNDEIAQRLAEIPPDTRDFTARQFGDPLPGRSALDRRRA